jgi:hypothetical protein
LRDDGFWRSARQGFSAGNGERAQAGHDFLWRSDSQYYYQLQAFSVFLPVLLTIRHA